MRLVVHVCNSNALEKLVFAVPNAEEQNDVRDIRLPHDRFRLKSDPVISLSISSQGVFLNEKHSNVFIINISKSRTCESIVSGDAEYRLLTADREELKLYVFFVKGRMSFYRIRGSHVISLGGGLGNTISCPENEYFSETHLMLKPDGDGCRLNVKGREGCYLNNRYVGYMESASVGYGAVITAGPIKLLWLNDRIGIERLFTRDSETGRNRLCIVRLEKTETPGEAVPAISGEDIEFNPVPRNFIYTDDTDIELDPPPPPKEIKQQSLLTTVGPSLTMAIPMSLGCGMYIFMALKSGQQGSPAYMYTGLITAVASALLGSMWALINLRNSKRAAQMEEEIRIRSYTEYIDRSNKMILDKYRYNTNVLLRNSLSVRELFQTPNQPCIWNRKRGSTDLFTYRLGKGRQPFRAQIKIPKEKFTVVPDELAGLPETLKRRYSELKDVPVCIDIEKNRLLGFVAKETSDISQLFINISLQIACVTEPYLIRMIFLFTNEIIPKTTVESMHWLPQAQGEDEHYVCTDNERADELLCGMDRLRKLPEYSGVRFVILTDDFKRLSSTVLSQENVSICVFVRSFNELPSVCSSVIQNDISFRGILNVDSGGTRREISFDSIPEEDINRYVRILAGLKFGKDARHSPIPVKVTLPELYRTDFFTAEDVLDNWRKNSTQNSLRAPVGMAEDGRVIFLDLHEKGHGPHGLIAGMTGSGKSEMLQTLILSLALRYSPEQIGFFLIDYKGGGMANLFEGLPHLIGSISNLSGNMIYRAMVSIRSENERRQRLFNRAGVNSIGDYGRLYSSKRVEEPLPHILMIIDEFAELKRNEPDFMKELISVAQVGRSLGVHLILATQKPSGTVDDNIFSNSRFRICLRVQDKQDSLDMLHRPEAAYISNPGRAYLQVGNDEMFECFQAGYTMEPYEERGDRESQIFLLDEYGRKHEIVRASMHPVYGDPEESKKTHFSMIYHILTYCKEEACLPEISRLWLPPLTGSIVLEDNGSESEKQADPTERYRIVIGRYDAPQMQEQGDYSLNLTETGHMVICGSALSGKSTFLQTLIYKHITGKTPKEINIYIVDYSNGSLSCFKDSNMVGGYINCDDEDRIKNLFCMLMDIMAKRRTEFGGVGFVQRLKNGEEKNPAVMLVIDNYGAFREKTDFRYDRDMQEIIKSGESYGIYAVLTGASIGSADVPSRLFENCRTGICLRMNDKYQYSECLRELRIPLLPDDGIAGRGLARIKGNIFEFQTGLCVQGNDSERGRKIQLAMREINAAFPGERAEEVPYIPDSPGIEDLDRCLESRNEEKGIPLGYDKQSGRPWFIPFDDVRILMIAGREQSGKTNACSIVSHYAKKRGMKTDVCPDIRSLDSRLEIKSGSDASEELIICDDMDEMLEMFYERDFDKETETHMTKALKKRDGPRIFCTLDTGKHSELAGRKIYELLRSASAGICLAGSLDKQSVFDFSYMSYTEQCATKPAGTGTLLRRHNTGAVTDIVIPLAEGMMQTGCLGKETGFDSG